MRLSDRDTKSPIVRFGIRFSAMLFLIVGLIGGPISLQRMMNERKAMRWPTVPGEITASDIQKLWAGTRSEPVWHYEYRYSVSGKDYKGGYLLPGTGYSGPTGRNAVDLHQAHPTGTIIRVRYDSLNPKSSYFGPGPNWTNYAVWLGLPPGMVVFGVMSWRAADKMKREARSGTESVAG